MVIWKNPGNGGDILMRRLQGLLCLIAVSVLFFFPVNEARAYTGTESGKGNNFLWSVEGNKNTVYLLGSIHVLREDSYPLPQAVRDIYHCCRKIVFETDLDGMNDPASREMMLKQGLYPPGKTLSENISPETHSLLRERLNESGLSADRFEQLRPWFAAMTITAMELQRWGFDPDLGIDRYFYQKAKRDGKELIFLETNIFQLNLMALMNKKNQDAFLKGVLRELDVIESLASDMLEAWRTGDAGRLDSILKKSHSEAPEIHERFFIQRNKKWITRIRRLLNEDEDILVIVGAGHLVGKESVVDLLRRKGYDVIQR